MARTRVILYIFCTLTLSTDAKNTLVILGKASLGVVWSVCCVRNISVYPHFRSVLFCYFVVFAGLGVTLLNCLGTNGNWDEFETDGVLQFFCYINCLWPD